MKVIFKTFEFDWRAVWGWKEKCSPKRRLRLRNWMVFFLLWRQLNQKIKKSLVIPVAKKYVWTLTEDCEINLFFINLETAEPENRETATNHSGKGACVYATYRDRSVCAVACSRDCITGSICLRFLFALPFCLNHSLFYPDNFISWVCRVLNIDEGTEISDRVDMHHASYQSALSSSHHLEISSSTGRHSDFTRRRSYTGTILRF